MCRGVLSVAQIGNSLRVLNDRNGDAPSACARRWPMPACRRRSPSRSRTWRTSSSSATRGRDDEQDESRMSLRRLLAIMVKELRQMRRDRITLAMIVGIPVMQLVLFGYAINLNLRGLRRASPTRRTPRHRARW